jgi:acyl CoA:acetate/3-ketoacid CoA transferase beta subunit
MTMAKKTSCPINRADFHSKAKPVSVNINGVPLQAEVKEFSTGSLGWYLNGKTMIDVGGTPVSVQIGMNLTIVGSKELPAEGGASRAEEVA